MRSGSLRLFLPALTALSLAAPAPVLAQSPSDLSIGATPFVVSVNPTYPAPYGTATLSFVSSAIDLARARMSVLVDGKGIYDGAVQPLSVPLGAGGSVTAVSITMSVEGESYRQAVSIQPQDVVLIAEPAASVPPLYPGKPPVPLEGNVRVVAIANLRSESGGAPDPSSFSYSWAVDGVAIANASGIGKRTAVVAAPLQYRARTVSVTVVGQGGTLVGGGSLSLSGSEPYVRLYKSDPLLGVRFEQALAGTYALGSSEATLYAAPFGFSSTGGAPLLEWYVDGAAVQTGNLVTLRPTGSGRGNASLSLVASLGDFARAVANLSLSFGSPGGGFFGL